MNIKMILSRKKEPRGISMNFELIHVGINCQDETEARQVSQCYSKLLNMELNENSNSIFVGKAIEVMKYPFLGKCGHMAYGVKSMEETITYLENINIEIDMETAVYGKGEQLEVVYLKGEFGGFAVHLKLIK